MWWAFVFVSSITEAYIFHRAIPTPSTKVNPHTLLTAMRAIVYVGFFRVSWQLALYLLPLALMFPFVHDGLYYHTRHKLNSNVYPLGWKDASTTTDAKFSFGYEKRKKLFLLGGVLWLIAVYASYRLSHLTNI